ncbi:hypothetical protein K8R04_03550 [Candidatus Uhrbacteria bacterium]|nr:hypothetical protein [Candidatus Uhrbacteria bacterium]
MLFGLPDLSSGLDNPETLAIRRFMDLGFAVEDHHDRLDELEQEIESDDYKVTASFSASCGYVLRLEMRKRAKSIETGFTLVEPGLGFHTPLIRFYRRPSVGSWLGFQVNLEYGSHEMRRLCKRTGLIEPSKRYECSDLVANNVFGKTCQMMLYGFMSR